jgi:hypothetical protein
LDAGPKALLAVDFERMKVSSKGPNGPNSITKIYDLLKWTIPHLAKFPRDQRFLLGDRIEVHLLDILELLLSAH